MPSTIGFRVFLPFFSSCQPMPSSRPFLVQPWFQLVMPSTSPHLKSFFKGLGGPKRSGSLQKSHFRETISKIVHWGFSVPPSDTVTKDFAPSILSASCDSRHKTLVLYSASATGQYDSQKSSLVHCSASATGRTTQHHNLLSAEVPYLTAK